jgi:hypothetical protein
VRGCLFTLLLGAALIAIFVVIGLPAIAAGAITAGVQAAGLQSDDTVVTVTSDPPTDLLGLHADRVRIRATDATFRGMTIGSLDLTLHDLHLVDRTAAAVDGTLDDVVATGAGGHDLTLDSVEVTGGGDTITATTTIPAAQVEGLIADGIEAKLGARPTDVRLAPPDRLTVELVIAVKGRFVVSDDGALQVRVTNGPAAGQVVTLLDADSGLPMRLTSATVTAEGDLELTGDLAVSLLGPLPVIGS